MENSNYSNSNKYQRNWNRMLLEGRVVGLAIVAAMNITNISNNNTSKYHRDIVSSAKAAANFRGTTTNGLFFASNINKLGIASGPHFVSPSSYFLSSCNLCNKHLHGVDIFIYRGERAFCSAECRETHIKDNDYQEKHKSGVVKMKPLDCSTPPCPAPHVSLAGIAAA